MKVICGEFLFASRMGKCQKLCVRRSCSVAFESRVIVGGGQGCGSPSSKEGCAEGRHHEFVLTGLGTSTAIILKNLAYKIE